MTLLIVVLTYPVGPVVELAQAVTQLVLHSRQDKLVPRVSLLPTIPLVCNATRFLRKSGLNSLNEACDGPDPSSIKGYFPPVEVVLVSG